MKTTYLVLIMITSSACAIIFDELLISPLFLLIAFYSGMIASHKYFTIRNKKEIEEAKKQ